jgi:hypothetical protein
LAHVPLTGPSPKVRFSPVADVWRGGKTAGA